MHVKNLQIHLHSFVSGINIDHNVVFVVKFDIFFIECSISSAFIMKSSNFTQKEMVNLSFVT